MATCQMKVLHKLLHHPLLKPISTTRRHFVKPPTIPKLPLLTCLPTRPSHSSIPKSDNLYEDQEIEDEDSVNKQVGPTLSLSVKEKKELLSFAHSLGDKLKSQLVGKSGVTINLASSFNETLQKNELLKIKVHRTCPGELDDVIKQLEEATESVAVGQIGRTVIIYKPSLKKMQLEEKKKQAARTFVRKEIKSKPFYLKKERGLGRPGGAGRGRTGSRRFS